MLARSHSQKLVQSLSRSLLKDNLRNRSLPKNSPVVEYKAKPALGCKHAPQELAHFLLRRLIVFSSFAATAMRPMSGMFCFGLWLAAIDTMHNVSWGLIVPLQEWQYWTSPAAKASSEVWQYCHVFIGFTCAAIQEELVGSKSIISIRPTWTASVQAQHKRHFFTLHLWIHRLATQDSEF